MRILISLASMIIGVLMTVVLVIAMNEAPPLKKRSVASEKISFTTPAAPPKITKKATPKAKPKKSNNTPPAPILSSGLSGMSFGLEGLEDVFQSNQMSILKENSAVVMTSETVDVPPTPVKRVAPEYPSSARRKGIEGYVTLSLLIDEAGSVQDIVVLDSYPEDIFENSATSTVREWLFQPGEYNNESVSVRVTQTLRYSLG